MGGGAKPDEFLKDGLKPGMDFFGGRGTSTHFDPFHLQLVGIFLFFFNSKMFWNDYVMDTLKSTGGDSYVYTFNWAEKKHKQTDKFNQTKKP